MIPDCSTNILTRGKRFSITAGVPVCQRGTTNLIKVHVIGDIIAKGQGIGKITSYGKIVIARNAEEAIEKMEEGDILVTYATDRDMMPAIEKASGLITEQGGLTSHAAVVGLSLGIPVVVGVDNAFDLIKDGIDVTLDGYKGDIYQGHASVL